MAVGAYSLDGCVVIDRALASSECNGCIFSGCMKYYHENHRNLLSGATFAYLCYTTQQNMGHLKRLVFNFQSVWEHEWAFMARAIMPRCPHCSFPEMLFLVTEKCHLFVLQSNPWWKVPLLWYYMFCPRKKYLFGHIKIILENFSTLLAYFRKIKKQIYPPRGLFFPNIWTG